MIMTPTIGRIVHLYPGENAKHLHFNGNGPNDPIAAVVVRVWSNDCVNLMALVDGQAPVWVTSVQRRGVAGTNIFWDWPQLLDTVPLTKAI